MDRALCLLWVFCSILIPKAIEFAIEMQPLEGPILRKLFELITFLTGLFIVGVFIVVAIKFFSLFNQDKEIAWTSPSVLVLRLEGIISDREEFLNQLRQLRSHTAVKAVVLRLNSPGGVAGTTQEIYEELRRVRAELQKPVVVSVNNVALGGGYYIALAADRIVTNPGSLLGAIEVSHLSPMVKELDSNVASEMYNQFKQTVMKERSLSMDVVNKYSDGRVVTGEAAVKLGFADRLGGFNDAVRLAGELAGLTGEPNVVYPPSSALSLRDFIFSKDIFSSEFLLNAETARLGKSKLNKENSRMTGLPLFLWQGALSEK